MALRRFHSRVAAVDFQGRPDTGKYEVSAPNALVLQPLHPVAHPDGQLPQYVGPLAYRRVFSPGTANEVDARGKGSGVPSPQGANPSRWLWARNR